MMEVDNVEKPTFKRRVAARLAPTKEVCQTIWATPGVAGKASALAKALELEPAKTTFSPGTKWSNPDLDPVAPDNRNWGVWDYVWLWGSNQFTLATWSLGSTLASFGFTLREIVPIAAGGQAICAIALTIAGWVGAEYHIGYPIVSRLSWGMRLAWFPVLVRGFMALMWLAILNLQVAQCLQQAIRAIWPDFENVPNALPASAGISSQELLCFFILLIIQTPLAMMPVNKLRWFYSLKTILSPCVFFGMMIWGLINVPGGGPLVQEKASNKSSMTILSAIFASAGGFSTVAANITDFSRYAKTPKATLIQMVAMPLASAIPVACAVVVSSCCLEMFGSTLWSPPLIMAKWDNRGAVFISAVIWVMGTVGLNLSDNSITASIALSSFCPKYLNFKRASFLMAILSVVICPWKIVNSSATFYNFLTVYPPLLGNITGIFLADYFILRSQNIDIRHLYVAGPQGQFWFSRGFNWRAVVAYLIPLAPNMPGIISKINFSVPDYVPWITNWSYLFSIIVAGLAFWLLNVISPPPGGLLHEAVHADDVIDWTTMTRIDDVMSGLPCDIRESRSGSVSRVAVVNESKEVSMDSEKA